MAYTTLNFPIEKGSIIDISTSSYSDRKETRHKVLRDINQHVIDTMHECFKLKTDQHEWETFDYEYILPYLVLNGYITAPEFVPYLDFGYETHITERDYIFDSYDKEEFENKMKKLIKKERL